MSVFYCLLIYLAIVFKISVKGFCLFCCSINVTQLGKRDGQTSKKKSRLPSSSMFQGCGWTSVWCMWMCVCVRAREKVWKVMEAFIKCVCVCAVNSSGVHPWNLVEATLKTLILYPSSQQAAMRNREKPWAEPRGSTCPKHRAQPLPVPAGNHCHQEGNTGIKHYSNLRKLTDYCKWMAKNTGDTPKEELSKGTK